MVGFRVLVIDDDRAFIGRARAALATLAEVRALTSGEDALTRARGWRPHVVLLDLLIEDADSIALLDRLLCPEGGRPPVVLCVGHEGWAPRLSPWEQWPVGTFRRSGAPAELRAIVGAALPRPAS